MTDEFRSNDGGVTDKIPENLIGQLYVIRTIFISIRLSILSWPQKEHSTILYPMFDIRGGG